MSDKTLKVIEERERRSRGEPEEGNYRDLQKQAKDLGIPANQSGDDLKEAISKAEESGAEGSA